MTESAKLVSVTRRVEFDAGHRVPGHQGACANPHGHRYRVEVSAAGQVADDGMVVDFGVLKQAMVTHVHDLWDHAFLVWEGDHVLLEALSGHGWKVVALRVPPTAEHLASIIFQTLTIVLGVGDGVTCPGGVDVTQVTVWETPNCYATVTRGDL